MDPDRTNGAPPGRACYHFSKEEKLDAVVLIAKQHQNRQLAHAEKQNVTKAIPSMKERLFKGSQQSNVVKSRNASNTNANEINIEIW